MAMIVQTFRACLAKSTQIPVIEPIRYLEFPNSTLFVYFPSQDLLNRLF